MLLYLPRTRGIRAAIFNGPGDIDVDERPRSGIDSPTDAISEVTRPAVCGSDLWFYRGDSDRDFGSRVGHESMGIVEAADDPADDAEPPVEPRTPADGRRGPGPLRPEP